MRIDRYLFEKGFFRSRTQSREQIEAGSVLCDGRPVTKASFDVPEGAHIEIIHAPLYVSRGGRKLEAALDAFSLSVEGMTALDIGASTGGFTDCLLRRGCRRVYAVDAGSGQLDASLRGNPAVISLENRNARYLMPEDIGELCDLCVMDLSFISQTLVHPAVTRLLRPNGFFLTLIKPQFEAGKNKVGKGGIVRNPENRKMAIDRVLSSARSLGFSFRNIIESPILGGDGNIEFLALFRFSEESVSALPPDCEKNV